MLSVSNPVSSCTRFRRYRLWQIALVAIAVLGSADLAKAATYYIDYTAGSDSNPGTKAAPWKRSPGMVGFAAAYSHQAGDVYTFKGGVTWPSSVFTLTVANSGASGAYDTFNSDSSWFAGSSFTLPVFDGGGAKRLWSATKRNWILVDGIAFKNAGTAGVSSSDQAAVWETCSHIIVRNSRFQTFAWIGMTFTFDSASTASSDIEIAANDISDASMGIVLATGASAATVDDVRVHDNQIHDFSSKMVGGVHGDGIHVWGNPSDSSEFFTNLKIFDNLFYGDFHTVSGTAAMTAFIFVEDATANALIYNNVGSYTNTSADNFGALISIHNHGAGGGHKIFNNTVRGGTAAYVAFFIQEAPNTTVVNNIITGVNQGADASSSPGTILDYNDDTSRAPSQGPHGIQSDPQFVSATDFHLKPTSPAIGKGESMAAYASTDKDGVARPAGAWSIGAYEKGSAVGTPTAPTNVRIIK